MVPHRGPAEPIRYRYLRTVYRGKGIASSSRFRWGLIALAVLIYTANFVGGDRGIVRRMQLQRELRNVTAENSRMRLEKERLIQEVKLKKNDPLSLEKVAREKYWMIGPDEVIYRFDDDEVVPDAAAPKARSGDDGGAEAGGAGDADGPASGTGGGGGGAGHGRPE